MYSSEKTQENYWPAAALWIVSLVVLVVIGGVIFVGTVNQLKQIEISKKVTQLEKTDAQTKLALSQNSQELMMQVEIYNKHNSPQVSEKIDELLVKRTILLENAWQSDPTSIIASRIDSSIIETIPNREKYNIETEEIQSFKIQSQISKNIFEAYILNGELVQIFTVNPNMVKAGSTRTLKALRISPTKYIILENI